jgi:hypothetical protein
MLETSLGEHAASAAIANSGAKSVLGRDPALPDRVADATSPEVGFMHLIDDRAASDEWQRGGAWNIAVGMTFGLNVSLNRSGSH